VRHGSKKAMRQVCWPLNARRIHFDSKLGERTRRWRRSFYFIREHANRVADSVASFVADQARITPVLAGKQTLKTSAGRGFKSRPRLHFLLGTARRQPGVCNTPRIVVWTPPSSSPSPHNRNDYILNVKHEHHSWGCSQNSRSLA